MPAKKVCWLNWKKRKFFPFVKKGTFHEQKSGKAFCFMRNFVLHVLDSLQNSIRITYR